MSRPQPTLGLVTVDTDGEVRLQRWCLTCGLNREQVPGCAFLGEPHEERQVDAWLGRWTDPESDSTRPRLLSQADDCPQWVPQSA